MIAKSYLTEMPYDIQTHKLLDSWVGRGRQVPLKIVDGSGLQTIGMLRPIRWWRRSIHRPGRSPEERMVLCCAVKHLTMPGSRLGDFCGSDHCLSLEVVKGEVVSVAVIEDLSVPVSDGQKS
jgi:hypothetical protein